MRFVLSLAAVLVLSAPVLAQPKLPNLPPDLMAPTDPLSPADERKQFTLPPGFDAQLVASEPDIQKPMQMAFDAKGRMWVTTSYHYPFAAEGKATDKLFVLSDFDPETGKARKVQTFASDLNIPIGVLPLPDCKSVIVSSVGEIRKYKIADGPNGPTSDGFEVLFKGFGTRDTHGMYNSYTLMPDGWVYACHGFANDSTVKGKDGVEVKMQSGHTFRFKPDGSKIEVWTRGQVNPFGMTVDPWFNLYTADCHSKPITQLIPGAYYDSFGKPHDGLGFAPHVTRHDHGSTGLCGLAWYDADHFPKDYLGCMFVGNVVTNRINFDKIEWRGASPVAKELPDFLVSKDRWFRPVDIKLGPDGALYVADFYNKIIGHYEVSLTDPRRDKDRGRLWRIVWTGKDGKALAPKFAYTDLTKEPIQPLHALQGHHNLTVRLSATLQMQQRHDETRGGYTIRYDNLPFGLAHDSWDGWNHTPNAAMQLASSLKAAREGGRWDTKEEEAWLVHRMRQAANRDGWDKQGKLGGPLRPEVVHVLRHKEPRVVKAAVEAVIFHPHADFVPPLIEVLKNCAPDDTHLRQAAKIALRNCFNVAPSNFSKLLGTDEKTDLLLAEVLLGARNGSGANALIAVAAARELPAALLVPAAELIGRYAEPADRERFVTRAAAKLDGGSDVLLALIRGVQARGEKLRDAELTAILALIAKPLEQIARDYVEAKKDVPAAIAARAQAGLRVFHALPPVAPAFDRDGTVAHWSWHLIESNRVPLDLRAACFDALFLAQPTTGQKWLRIVMLDKDTPPALVERALIAAAGSSHTDARLDARDALKNVPYRTAVPIGLALASTKGGAEDLLIAVKEGKAPARLLQEKAILERLKASNAEDWQKRVAELTKNLPPADQRLADLIKKRSAAFATAKIDKDEGAKLFTKHCAACHRIGDQGGKIAPQLDGIGVRGVERLLEDILDPNRNVDQAFRARSITLTNEKTLTALMLRVEGKVLVVADLEGKEQRIPLDEIAVNRETMLSAMPANFDTVVPEADLYKIVAYLLEQKAKEPPKKE